MRKPRTPLAYLPAGPVRVAAARHSHRLHIERNDGVGAPTPDRVRRARGIPGIATHLLETTDGTRVFHPEGPGDASVTAVWTDAHGVQHRNTLHYTVGLVVPVNPVSALRAS